MVNFLDITFDLSTESHKPYKNLELEYINIKAKGEYEEALKKVVTPTLTSHIRNDQHINPKIGNATSYGLTLSVLGDISLPHILGLGQISPPSEKSAILKLYC